MIHGGLRYLQKDPEVTLHSCVDSGAIQRIAPHLVFRIPFVMPVFAEDPIGPELVEVGLEMYDRYQPYKNGRPHTRLSARRRCAWSPPSRRASSAPSRWTNGAWTRRGSPPPTRSTPPSAARRCGPTSRPSSCCARPAARTEGTARTEARPVTGARSATAHRRRLADRGRPGDERDRPWVPKLARLAGVELRLRPAKGIHLVFERRVSQLAVYARGIDGRDMFTFPHEQNSMAGTPTTTSTATSTAST